MLVYIEDDSDDRFVFESVWTGVPNAPELVLEPTASGYAKRLSAPDAPVRLPRLILVDLNLPAMNGFEFLEWLRGRPQTRFVPVVMFSSSNNPAEVRRAYSLGANGYVVKPDSLDGLTETVEALRRFWFGINVPGSPDG